MPHFQHTYETYSEDVAIISVNLGVNETEQAIANVQQKYSLTVPTVIDESGKLAQGVNLIGTPYHVLIDLDGNIVFKGHDVSEKLNNTLKLLASSNSVTLPTITVKDHIEQSVIKQHAPLTALFFTSTWCDWYLKKSRPAISQNCVMGQQYVNALAQQTPQFNWLGVISHLWTGEKEMIEYQEKYQISYPMLIDSQEHAFVQYQVKDYPTLILLKDGQEVYRVSDFSEITEISKSVLAFN
jgi:peroxiredoxin